MGVKASRTQLLALSNSCGCAGWLILLGTGLVALALFGSPWIAALTTALMMFVVAAMLYVVARP